jgi:Uma2 family endonuclease
VVHGTAGAKARIDGELVVSPRPAPPHAQAASAIGGDLQPAFGRRGGGRGPGGWWILDEPELHLGDHVLVPDLAGWRRERLPTLPEGAGFTVPPDWICEVISPSSIQRDRVRKMHLYASFAVSALWLVDPLARVLESYRLDGGAWVVAGSWAGSETVRVPPFQDIELDLDEWWLPQQTPDS